MDPRALFLISAFFSLLASVVAARLWIWPRLRMMERTDALAPLVAPHMLLRTLGLSFLVPGVVSPLLPAAFAEPAAYGDLVACVLAIAATLALSRRARWALALVWVFNVWGTADLLYAVYQARAFAPGLLGAAFFIPTAIVPAVLVTHGLIFLLLLRSRRA